MFKKFLQNEEGATAIEYGLIAALIAIALITTIKAASGSLQGTFTKISTELNDANK